MMKSYSGLITKATTAREGVALRLVLDLDGDPDFLHVIADFKGTPRQKPRKGSTVTVRGTEASHGETTMYLINCRLNKPRKKKK